MLDKISVSPRNEIFTVVSSQTEESNNATGATGALSNTLNDKDIQDMLQARGHSQLLKNRTGHQLMLVAHRGTGPTSVFGSTFPEKYVAENSLLAIKSAILSGADAIEIDIFKSRDGIVMVTHDDEIWRNEFGADRSGSRLPDGETKASYLVGQKTADELKNIQIGRNGESIPTLLQVTELVNNANQELIKYGEKPIILNIELKDSTAVTAMLDLVQEGGIKDGKLSPDNIIFCSFKHEALKELKAEAEQRGLKGINIAPGIKTADLFGQDNMKEDFSLKDPNAGYQLAAMDNLKKLVEGSGFQGYDGILWDLRTPIADLAVAGNKAIHASTSDFRQYSDNRDFSLVLLELSKRVETFFKCDNVDDARKVLLESSILLDGVGIQMMYKQTENGDDCFYFYQPNNQQNTEEMLDTGAKKAIAYSKL